MKCDVKGWYIARNGNDGTYFQILSPFNFAIIFGNFRLEEIVA